MLDGAGLLSNGGGCSHSESLAETGKLGVRTRRCSWRLGVCGLPFGLLLYFIGEVVDVTGWLGGYNFQWAWSSAHACAMALPH
jgi:predicted flavoprotein YhiN